MRTIQVSALAFAFSLILAPIPVRAGWLPDGNPR
jgi:hypothetical protein